ncbi:DUF2500 domain-containing protein [Saccharibacillus kuerlensis]|uniref:DUF2500 domain-containing protein n=1 Tax=Saccharibacillus kuerlensis TaxID=459527 RepID=A0ABQ2KUG8_9BACL|nr:DUF2500 domain-containing protein [Saccharibacillus kuerlensis]GGN90819.1 hypothetical protein GCM10010969_01710 [Saccharibacillus kuerlensis]
MEQDPFNEGEFIEDVNGDIVHVVPEEAGIMSEISGFFDGAPLWFVIPFLVIMLLVVSVFVLGIGSTIIKSMREKRNNNAAGVSTLPARVFGKRTEMQGGGEFRVRTVYHVAFELETGERKEFEVSGEQYGIIGEDDRGMLTFKGTRFEQFDRNLVS